MTAPRATPISSASRDEVIFTMALAIRRLLILTDKRTSAARFAAETLAAADRELGR